MVRDDARRIVPGRASHPRPDEQPEVCALQHRVRRGDDRPQDLFSYCWHPYAIDPNVDFSKEERTLVESDVSRQAITKHLRVLSDAGLVRSTRKGREQVWDLEQRRLDDAHAYLDRISKQWDEALDRLRAFVEE